MSRYGADFILAMTAILTLALFSANRATAAERPLTLREAIVLALRNNEGILVEREALSSAEAAVTGAKGAYDPFLTLDGGWRRASEPVNSAFSGAPAGQLAPTSEGVTARAAVSQYLPTGGQVLFRAEAARDTTDGAFTLLSPAYGTRVGVQVSQPLLRDRAVDPARTAIRIAASDREGAAASLERSISDTVAEVERAYWTLAATRREVEVQAEAVRLAEEQLAETQVRIDNGVLPETEIAQPRAEIERRRGELLASREAVSRAENDLKVLILSDTDEALWLEPLVPAEDAAPEVSPIDVPASLERALASRSELGQALAAVETRRVETALADDGVRPSLDAILSYDRLGLAGEENPEGASVPGLPAFIPSDLEGGLGQSFETLGSGDFDDARVALVFGLPLGNRSAKAAAAVARNSQRQAEADLARLRKNIRAEVLDAAAGMQTAGQRIEAARAAREAAEVQLSAERDRYGVGLSTNFLVLTRQNDLSRARLDEIEASTDYRTALTEMARATGWLLRERGIDVSDAARPDGVDQ